MNDINEWLSPEGCSKATYQRIKGNFYDYQLENFERRKETSSPDELRQYIAERKKVCNDEIVRLSPFIESHENTKCIISCLNWFLKFYHYEEEKLKKPAPRVQSFSWTGSPEQLQKLYYGLNDGFIDPSKTDLEDFIAIFAGDGTGNDLHRVTWIKKTQKSKVITKNAVIALFDILAESGKIPKEEIKNRAELFKKLQTCFADPEGNPMRFEHSHLKYSKDCAALLKKIVTSL